VKNDISDFLWKGDAVTVAESNQYFCDTGFGNYRLRRDRVVENVFVEIELQLFHQPIRSTGVYLSGCRGMGKTCDLMLIAKAFQAKGWEVYWFASASSIPQGIGMKFKTYANENMNKKKIAVIVDEVHTQSNSDLFVALLKDAPPNLTTIGAAVPVATGNAQFRRTFRTHELVLKQNDDDVRELIEHWKTVNEGVVSSKMVEYVSTFLLNYCGGHVYPVLALMQHFFTDKEAKQFLTDVVTFNKRVYSPDFTKSTVYEMICNRCFDGLSTDPYVVQALNLVLTGRAQISEFVALARVGWWNIVERSWSGDSAADNRIISTLLKNECLERIGTIDGTEIPKYLDNAKSPEENMEFVIMEGLYNMEPSTFTSPFGSPVEDALSNGWSQSVKSVIRNVHVRSQMQMEEGGRMDFYVNGVVDHGFECIRNATQTRNPTKKGQSADIDKHLDRFLSGQYPMERYVILNFAMNGESPVLPRLEEHHNKVYTYLHDTNELYRGNKCIRAPAVKRLPCPSNPVGSRGFCTAAAGMAVHIPVICSPRNLVKICGKFLK
jgi:hypothetical protein